MAARRRPTKSSTPLDERQRKLQEEQAKLQELTAKLNRVIEEAPKIKAKRVKAQREELLADRSMRAVHRLNSNTIADTRFDQFGGRQFRRRPLKAERRQTLLMFCALLLALAFLVLWLLSVWHHQWPS